MYRRILTLLLVFVLAISLASVLGCAANEPETTQTQEDVVAPQGTGVPAGDAAQEAVDEFNAATEVRTEDTAD